MLAITLGCSAPSNYLIRPRPVLVLLPTWQPRHVGVRLDLACEFRGRQENTDVKSSTETCVLEFVWMPNFPR